MASARLSPRTTAPGGPPPVTSPTMRRAAWCGRPPPLGSAGPGRGAGFWRAARRRRRRPPALTPAAAAGRNGRCRPVRLLGCSEAPRWPRPLPRCEGSRASRGEGAVHTELGRRLRGAEPCPGRRGRPEGGGGPARKARYELTERVRNCRGACGAFFCTFRCFVTDGSFYSRYTTESCLSHCER